MRVDMDGFIKIPNAILNDKSLSHTEMILYGYILLLSHNKNYCFATNKVLGDYIGRSKDRTSKMIGNLEEKWYIRTEEWPLRKIIPIVKNDKGVVKNNEGVVKNDKGGSQKWLPYIDNILLDISKDISKGERCKVSELIEAYKSDKILPQMMDDIQLVQERAEYKQQKKDRAYKTVWWFLQQLKVCITTVRHNEVRGDTNLRFRFAMNQAMEKTWKSMYWDDKIEAAYQQWKKIYLLEQKQNE